MGEGFLGAMRGGGGDNQKEVEEVCRATWGMTGFMESYAERYERRR